jgi:hypothetical protein
MCTPVTPAVPYLLLGLQDVQWAVENSCGARKLARTPHVNQKKNKNMTVVKVYIVVKFKVCKINRVTWSNTDINKKKLKRKYNKSEDIC